MEMEEVVEWFRSEAENMDYDIRGKTEKGR